MVRIIIVVLIMFIYSRGAAPPPPESGSQTLYAVVDIINNTGEHVAFSAGMPDMLITELLKSGGIRLLERTKVQTAMKALKLEASGLTDESNLRLGKWLGADGLIVGAFN
jgi:curli biogenesis system outer membrane secretion channel CsgG